VSGAQGDGGSVSDEPLRACGADGGNFFECAGICQAENSADGLAVAGAEPSLLFRELAKDKQASAVFFLGMHRNSMTSLPRALGSKKHLTALKKAGVALVELKRLSPPMANLCGWRLPKLLRRAGIT